MGVLDGIRVLDYGRFIAAPWCSALLADMGADVVRIEKREGGEDRWVQSVTESGEGGTFLQCNRNKRSLTLDTTTDEGKEITRKLVARADIVVANMPAAGMRASGLDYETLRAVKPDIILASATAYGEGGPYSDRIGFDGAGQVMSGAVYRQGLPDQPIRTVVPYADFGTALTLTIGVMMALYHRDRTGEGQHVEGALLPTAMMLSNAFLIERDLLGTDKPRMGNQGTSVAPCDLYRTSDDGWVLLQIAGPPMFKRWCRLVGRAELFDDPALRRRRSALGERRRAQRHHGAVVCGQDQGRGPRAARRGETACSAPAFDSGGARRPARAGDGLPPARPVPGGTRMTCRSSRPRFGCRPRPAPSVGGHRCSASTPTRFSTRSATPLRTSRTSRTAAWCEVHPSPSNARSRDIDLARRAGRIGHERGSDPVEGAQTSSGLSTRRR